LNAARHVIIERTRNARLPAIYQFPDALQRLPLSSQRRRVFIVFQLNDQLRLWQIEA
jgi:hypothetical protein